MLRSQTLFWLLLSLFLVSLPVLAFAQSAGVPGTEPALVRPVDQHSGSQLTVSAFVVLFINWLKKTRLAPFITQETPRINRTVAIVASFLAAVGVHATFDQGAGTLVVTGLNLTGIITMALAWGKSYVFQQTIFNMTKSPAAAPPTP